MKTLAGLLAVVLAGWNVSAGAQALPEVFQCAEHAHALSAEIAAHTLPHAQFCPDWNRAAQRAVAADNAAAAVQRAMSVGDYCAAYDAAERLDDLADDLTDDADALEPVLLPFGPPIARDEVRHIERLAKDLRKEARTIRRETKRLDEAQARGVLLGGPVIGAPVIGSPAYGVPVVPGGGPTMPRGGRWRRPASPFGRPAPSGTVAPYGGVQPYGTIQPYDAVQPYGTVQPGGTFNDYGSQFGPAQSTPPAEFDVPAPPKAYPPSQTIPQRNYDRPSLTPIPAPLPSNPGPMLPGQSSRQLPPSALPGYGLQPAPQLQPYETGPALIVPSAG